MAKRTLHLACGLVPRIVEESIGNETCVVLFAGQTKNGKLHEVRVRVGDGELNYLCSTIKAHFAKRAERLRANALSMENVFK